MSVVDDLEALAEEHVEEEDGVVLEFQTKKFTLEALIMKSMNAVPTRNLMPVLSNFLIEVEENHLRVAASDLQLSVLAESPLVTVKQPGRAVFPAKKLQEIVRAAPDGEVHVSVEVKNNKASAHITATSSSDTHPSKWVLRLMQSEDFPVFPDASEEEFVAVSRSKFLQAVKQVRQAVTQDTMRGNLRMIDIRDGKVRASDGVRYQQVELEFPLDIAIPINAVDDLVKVLGLSEIEEFSVADTDRHLLFRIGKDLFIAQKMSHEFPSVDETLLAPALENQYELHVDRKALVSAIRRVRITSDEETSVVLLHIEDDSVTVSSKDKKGSYSEQVIDATWKGPNARTMAYNHKHLLDMLAMADSTSCEFRLGKEIKNRPQPLLLKDDKAKMVGVLLQMRLSLLS